MKWAKILRARCLRKAQANLKVRRVFSEVPWAQEIGSDRRQVRLFWVKAQSKRTRRMKWAKILGRKAQANPKVRRACSSPVNPFRDIWL